MSHADLLSALERLPGKDKPGDGRMLSCPVHGEDRDPSLSMDIGTDDAILLSCMAGCRTEDIIAALGFTMADLYPDRPYTNGHARPTGTRRAAGAGERSFEARYPDGSIAGFHKRIDDGSGRKRIWWEPRGVEPKGLALFLSWSLPDADPVVITEGERATLAVLGAGHSAVGTYGTGATPEPAALEPLRERTVVLWPDHDDKGREHMETIAGMLVDVASSIRIVRVPDGSPKGWDAADADRDTILALVGSAEPWTDGPSVRPISSYDSTPIEWVWPGWLPRGTVTLFDGNPGEAKSTAVMDLIARITTGGSWPDGRSVGEPSDVLIITREDDPSRVLRPRLEVARADLSRVLFLEEEFVLPRDAGRLERIVSDRSGLALVFIDPLFSHIEGRIKTISDNDIRTAVMTPLSNIAQRARLAMLAMRHYSKDTTRSALLRGAGSLGGLVGAARSVWAATGDPDSEDHDRKLIGVVKANYARKPDTLRYRVYSAIPPGWAEDETVAAIEWLGTSQLGIDDVLSEEDHDAARSATDVLVAYLRSQGGEAPARDVEEHMRSKKVGGTALRSAKRRAGVRSVKRSYDSAWYWTLPEEAQEVQGV